ncbi:hypothetical protein KVR01_010832 [Diaporthe batatas]|uniref:uncharacterized protein n=1 Tax=Diaporthe batatas TaxID=748121 RepID=UPI001D045CFA|nr:uncharacterized protein KVR01_010832 [Diaporthe batatas]KAG8159171.1 hypothetical protein KVR01_010832 [Diaporthe batatas]
MANSTEPPQDGETQSLAHSINIAIAPSHTRINRLILDRMPHAVPPRAENPSSYITGLLHIGAVYIAFESLWQNIIGIHTEIAPLPYTYPFGDHTAANRPGLGHGATPPPVPERTRHILETAYWPNMLRAARVKSDIRAMTGWPAHVVDEQLRSAGTTGALGAYLEHIKEAVDSRPHILLAYAYSLYLALLSGGSYIRTELMYLRAEFWLAVPDPVRPGMIPCTREASGEPGTLRRHSASESGSESPGLVGEEPPVSLPLSFLDFDTPLGHENPRQQAKDLKAEFKRRFVRAEQALTEPERRDIVGESMVIFDHLEAVVGQLDRICSSGAEASPQGSSRSPSTTAGSQRAGIGSRLRDSIAIAKGRLLRTVKRSSGAGSSVTATSPSAVRTAATPMMNDATASPSDTSESFNASSLASAGLSQSAIVPGEGFRTVRYSDHNRQLDTSAEVARREAGGYDGTAEGDHGSAGRDYQVCPIGHRTSTSVAAGATERAPDRAIYALLSNIAVIFGIAMALAAYLFVRRCDGIATTGAATFMGKDW